MPELPFSNFTFVFTGDMNIDRDTAKSKVIMLGGRVTTAVSSKTTFLVAGSEPGPKKLEKAESLQIKILDETAFMEMINKNHIDDDEFDVNVKKPKIEETNGAGQMVSQHESTTEYMWTEKYRPKCIDDLVGNQAAADTLTKYLEGKSKSKCALLSGQPGIGKTTLAIVVADSLGFDIVEFNASDVRNKSSISNKLKTLNYMSLTRNAQTRKKVVIMDEIDGMTSDRGGLPELTKFIKESMVHVICICNDRNNQKIRTLANYALDIRFRKPTPVQIKQRLNYILEKENKQMRDNFLNEILKTCNGDIRYCINTIQNLLLRNTLNHEQMSTLVEKNIVRNIFETTTALFAKRKVNEKMDLYFEDYNFVPLFVYENYTKTSTSNIYELRSMIESISYADIVDKHIHGPSQEWNLLPVHAFFSSVYPSKNRNLNKRIDFPSYLGQLSKKNKNNRNLTEVMLHCFKNIFTNKLDFRIYTVDLLFNKIVNLMARGMIEECLNIFKKYDLIQSDFEILTEIVFDGGIQTKSIGAKNKSAFTRAYKKMTRKLPYDATQVKSAVNTENTESSQ